MSSRHSSGSTPVRAPGTTSPLLIYTLLYICGAITIASAVIGLPSNPLIAGILILGTAAGLYFISTPQGKAFIAKHSERHLDEQFKSAYTVLSKETLTQELTAKGLMLANQKVVFNQWATYQCGITGHPNSATSQGMAVVLDKSFVFYDQIIAVKMPYSKIQEVKLEHFQVGAIRSMMASGAVALQLQQTQNILSISYVDDKGIERNAKFRVNGAHTIPGEGERARELLNHLLEFKGNFISNHATVDPMVKLEKLKALKDQGIISEAEFEAKKSKLLEQI